MYVRRKTSPGRADYYQLVESRRVDGKPRQRVLLHLGQRSSVKEALKEWPREIRNLRGRGHEREADALEGRLERLRRLFPQLVGTPKNRWKVRGFGSSEGLRWVREALASYDWSKCQKISVRREKGRINLKKGTSEKFRGKCWLLSEDGDYGISIRVSYLCSFPQTVRSGAKLGNENELLVWLIAHEAAHYLFFTEQIAGENAEEECDAFANEMLGQYRSLAPPWAAIGRNLVHRAG